jgi:hypothetical protein
MSRGVDHVGKSHIGQFRPASDIRNFAETRDRPGWPPVWFGTVPLISSERGEPLSINPFDDDNGSFLVLVTDHEQTQPVADLRRNSRRQAGGSRRSGPRWVSGLYRTELGRYAAEESMPEAGPGAQLLIRTRSGWLVGWNLIVGRFR